MFRSVVKVMLICALLAPGAASVAADADAVSFAATHTAIQAQPLVKALKAVAAERQTGLKVLAKPAAVRGKASLGAPAGLSATEAVAQVLRDTGLKLVMVADGTVATRKADLKSSNETGKQAVRMAVTEGEALREQNAGFTQNPGFEKAQGEAMVALVLEEKAEKVVTTLAAQAVMSEARIAANVETAKTAENGRAKLKFRHIRNTDIQRTATASDGFAPGTASGSYGNATGGVTNVDSLVDGSRLSDIWASEKSLSFTETSRSIQNSGFENLTFLDNAGFAETLRLGEISRFDALRFSHRTAAT